MIGWRAMRRPATAKNRRNVAAVAVRKIVLTAKRGSGPGAASTARPPRRERRGVEEVPAVTDPAVRGPARTGPGRVVRALVALVALAGMVAFAVVLAKLTLGESAASVTLVHDNLTPGRSIEAYLRQPAFVDTVKQLGGNVVLGMPFGVLLPLLSRKARGLVRVALVTVGTMLLVELIQGALVTGRAFDVDDVLLNTTGALLAYLLVGRRLGRAVHPRTRRRWWRRRPPDAYARP
ncbi:VanZ family protein [Streptomyces sp. 2RAF24]|uniref:VanZ family protein n=1 Tax=Streptomyces sp. 2RAF24 TaxID=3232997 RepID=UPI003F97F074